MEGGPDKDIDHVFHLLFPTLQQKIIHAFTEVIKKASFFVSFNDLQRYIFIMLEKHVNLSPKEKETLNQALEKIYTNAHTEIYPLKEGFDMPDIRALQYAEKLHDFYLGRFFQGDRQLRLRVLGWMSQYYLEQGNPIGKGQKGVKEFLDAFGEYIVPQTEWKARQIIDTSVNFLRNSARLRAIQKAKITHYRWDATNDRLTCAACRSMDGRIFKTESAIRVLDMLEASEDPSLIKELKPIQTTVQKGPSSGLPNKFPPLHPHCRCRVVAEMEEVEMPISVETPEYAPKTITQMELEEEFTALTQKEIENKIKAHWGSDWFRPATGEKGVNAYKKSRNKAEDHFRKHGHEFGFSTAEEYYRTAKEVIKNPDEVYVERKKEKDYYIFKKGDAIVISEDETLLIKSFYRLKGQPFKQWVKEMRRDGFIKIL